MALFEFQGDLTQDHDPTAFVRMHGMTFMKGEAVEVTDNEVIAKLDGNSHFARVDGRTKAARTRKTMSAGGNDGDKG